MPIPSKAVLVAKSDSSTRKARFTTPMDSCYRQFVAALSAKTAGFAVSNFVPKWRTRHDSNV
jgi:hypothetical protein